MGKNQEIAKIIINKTKFVREELYDIYLLNTIEIPTKHFPVYDNRKCLLDLGDDYEMKLSYQNNTPFWVVNFDRWIFDKRNDENKVNINYDLILLEGFCELGSGGEREINKRVILQKMQELGIDPEEHDNYLRLLDYNFIPSAGIGLGIQRFLKYFSGNHDITNVMPFAREVASLIKL